MRSRSPQVEQRSGPGFHIRRSSAMLGDFPSNLNDDVEDINENELDVFQQEVSLDRQEENAAIEIFLEDSGEIKLPGNNQIPHASLKQTCTAQESRKKASLFSRWFKGDPRKPSSKPPVSPSSTRSSSSDHDDQAFVPTPPSTVRRTRSFKDLSATVHMSNQNRVRKDNFDTFSCVSSLSGSRATTVMPHRRVIGTPLKLDRHESLGMESIVDIRNTLKVMERQLDKASNNGERVSRQKVMRALFTVADSLEDLEEREMLRGELQGIMDADRQLYVKHGSNSLSKMAPVQEDVDQENEEHRGNFNKRSASQKSSSGSSNKSFNLFSTIGKMFHISNDEQKAVEKALDDLLWTEFVATRKEREAKDERQECQSKAHLPPNSGIHKKTTLEVKQTAVHSRASTFANEPFKASTMLDDGPSEAQPFARTWWGGSKKVLDANEEDASSSSSSWNEHEDLDIDDDGFDEDEDDDTSECNLDYLPTSITVQRPLAAQPLSPMKQSFALPYGGWTKKKETFTPGKPSNSRYKVRMVDTESRLGFETGSACLSTK